MKVKELLENYKDDPKDMEIICLTWDKYDVEDLADSLSIELTEEQKEEIIKKFAAYLNGRACKYIFEQLSEDFEDMIYEYKPKDERE